MLVYTAMENVMNCKLNNAQAFAFYFFQACSFAGFFGFCFKDRKEDGAGSRLR